MKVGIVEDFSLEELCNFGPSKERQVWSNKFSKVNAILAKVCKHSVSTGNPVP